MRVDSAFWNDTLRVVFDLEIQFAFIIAGYFLKMNSLPYYRRCLLISLKLKPIQLTSDIENHVLLVISKFIF